MASRLVRSTIGVRLTLVMAVPLVGLAVLGALVARGEWQERSAAAELRREAELVELLSSAEVTLELELESLVGLKAADAVGLDLQALIFLLGDDAPAVTSLEAARDIDAILVAIAQQERAVWADPDAVDRLLAGAPALRAAMSDPVAVDAEFERTAGEMRSAVAVAHVRQSERLGLLAGQLELGPGLLELSELLRPSRELMLAAEAERQVLTDYALPIGDGMASRDELIVASAAVDLRLAEVEQLMPSEYRSELDEVRRTSTWTSYEAFKQTALSEEFEPQSDLSDVPSLVPAGIASFLHGFDRTRLLLAIARQISADFTTATLNLESAADGRLRQVAMIGVVFAALSLVLSDIAIRSITNPVRALFRRARLITDGDLATVGPRRGPADVGLVHATLDEMSANLRTLADQADALSAGRLEDEVLSHTVVGPLGDSVHGSFVRLRSMTARLEHEATHDALTGLANRAAVISLLDRCLTGRVERRTPLGAVMLDLNGFKQANDNMGHAVGDELLIQIANRLRRDAPEELVARLGGDEFMIIATGPSADSRIDEIARRAVAVIGRPLSVSFGTVSVTASAGVVSTEGPTWLPTSEVLRRADLALYEAKQELNGGVVRFDRRLHDSLLETTRLQGEIRHALDRGEFDLAFQPIVDVDCRTITGYEALIRWRSPSMGLVPPDLFIPVAEQSELITHIDDWVLARSAAVLGAWHQDSANRELSLSVNVSARHLSNTDLVETVARAIRDNDIEADRYLIEITESQLIPNLRRAEDSLRGLKALGVKLAIDDFGTGYASVAHLRRVQFDRLKIDQSFIAELGNETDRSLAGLLVSLGRDLQLEVVAEGIETVDQFAWARDAGCTHAQGYWIGRPGPLPAGEPIDTRPV